MALSYLQPVGNGTNILSVTFPYLSREHVKVYTGYDVATGAGTELVAGLDWTWLSDTSIWTTVPSAHGVVLTIIRKTPSDARLVVWAKGSPPTPTDLNTSDLQNLYAVQEQQDRNDSAIIGLGASAAAANAAAANAAASADNAATQAAAAIASVDVATAAATAVTTTANAASSAANAAVQIATAAATPQSAIQVLEPLQVLVNAAFSVGRPGAIPFGVGPVLTPGTAFSGISQSDYYPIHHASGSFC